MQVKLRDPNTIMKLSRLGSFHQSKLSFLRSFLDEFKDWEYKRDLFDKPIGHAVQMIAIKQLKDLGCKTYLLGEKAVALSSNVSSKKEASISHFKEGFAGYVFAQPHLEISLNE